MELPTLLSVTPIYAALLGLIFIPITARAGFYRVKSQILIGDGGDPELLRRIRGQGNFIETVPIVLILLVLMELVGASDTWLHALGAVLVLARISHYLGLTELGPGPLRAAGMGGTILCYLLASGWLLYALV